MKQLVFFISGHRDLTQEEFDREYVPQIKRALAVDGLFVIGDYYGADIMAQTYLSENGEGDRVTVYHMFDSPRNLASGISKTVGGFKTDVERDSAMTDASDIDIALIRKGRWTSGTAQNILRRYEKFD